MTDSHSEFTSDVDHHNDAPSHIDPDLLDDAIDYGRYLIPLVRQELAHRDATGRRGEVVAQPPLEAERELAEVSA